MSRAPATLAPAIAAILAAASASAQVPTTDVAASSGAAEVTVRAVTPAAPRTETTVLAAEAARGAGTQGDAVKALQSLPGLGRGSAGSGDVVAWGSSPRESSIYMDDVRIPALYHGSGVRSVVPSPLLATVSVAPGAFGVDEGDSVGGIVRLSSAPIDDTRPSAALHADLLDAGAIISAPLPLEHSAARASARYGYVDRWLPQAIDRDAFGLVVVPSYWDAQADASFALGSGGSLRVASVLSSDRSRTEVDASDPSRARSEQVDARFGRIYARYSRRGAGSETTVTPFFGWDTNDLVEQFGGEPSELDVESTTFGVRANARRRLSNALLLTLGADVAVTLAHVLRAGSPAVPRREGDPYPFGTPPGADYGRDDYDARTFSSAPYAALEAKLGPLRVEPGVRLDGLLIESSRNRPPLGTVPDVAASNLRGIVDPRATVEYAASPRATVFASAGRYHQAPDVADLGAVFGNPALGPERATHAALGERARLSRTTTLELVAFSKWLTAVAARSPAPTPRVSEGIVGTGKGRAFGVQLFLRQRPVAGFSGFVSATLSRSERRDPGQTVRLSDYDAPLVAAVGLQKTLGSFQFGLRTRYASGLPRTAVVGAYYDLARARYAPELGPTNGIRLGNFFELDLRCDYRVPLPGDGEMDLYVDALNVTAHANPEEYVYSSDFRTRGIVTGLPSLVVAGVSVEL